MNIKTIKLSLVLIIFSLLNSFTEIMAQDPPSPNSGFDGDGCVGCVPIDDYLPLLFFAGLVFAMWVINKRNRIKVETIKIKK